MDNKKKIGNFGEKIASEFLIKKGYHILEKNYKCNFGEIDIVAYNEKEIIFLEVKTRRTDKYGSGIQAIDTYKQRHIYKTAESFLCGKCIHNVNIRIDAIEIYINNNSITVNHYLNIINEKP